MNGRWRDAALLAVLTITMVLLFYLTQCDGGRP